MPGLMQSTPRMHGVNRAAQASTAELEQYQAELARDFYTLAFSHPAVEAIIWWTITDLEPWRDAGRSSQYKG